MGKEYKKKIVLHREDVDSDPRRMTEGSAVELLNGRVGTTGDWENISGTKEVVGILPSGVNKCKAFVHDIKNQRAYYLIWNSNGYHGVYAYQPQVISEKIKLLYGDTPTSQVLNFSEHTTATCKVFDGKYLLWLEHNYNPPRALNLEWCYVDKKQWYVSAVDPENPDIVLNGTINGASFEIWELFDFTLLPEPFSLLFDVEKCDCKYIFTEKVPGTVTMISPDFVPYNFYDIPHNERQIDFVNWPLVTGPKVRLEPDVKYLRNLLSGNTWQFRSQLKYKDGTFSVWSPWSKMIDTTDDCFANFNRIIIDYSDPVLGLFADIQQTQMVESVILGYRNTNIGKLHKFAEIDMCAARTANFKYVFYNDVSAQLVGDEESISHYDSVPLQAGQMEIITNRVGFGDVTENYDGGCGEFEIVPSFTPKIVDKKATVRCKIYIKSDFHTGIDMPIGVHSTSAGPDGTDKTKTSITFGLTSTSNFGSNEANPDKFEQYLPDGGWWGYLRGTDYRGLSEQKYVPNVEFYDAARHILDLTNEDNRRAALAASRRNGLYSVLDINGVSYGTYVFCLASHLVTAPDDGGVDKLHYGECYNVNNLTYQKTSTHVLGIRENGVFKSAVREFVVTIDDSTVVNGVVEIPDFIIGDYAHMLGNDNAELISGYVIDPRVPTGSNATGEDISRGTSVERAMVNMKDTGGSGGGFLLLDGDRERYVTDHNGFYFGTAYEDPNRAVTFSAKEETMPNEDLIRPIDNVFIGRLSQLFNNTATPTANASDLLNAKAANYVNIPNFIPEISKYNSTFIRGTVRNQDGSVLAGIKVVCTETGRVEITGADGVYEILVYVRTNTHQRKGKIIFYDDRGCITANFVIRSFDMEIGSNAYNSTNKYPLDVVINSIHIGQSYFLKNGGVYGFGITEDDRANRKTTVLYDENMHLLRLPFTTEKIQDYLPKLLFDTNGKAITADTKADGTFSINVVFKKPPPIFCTHALIARTSDQMYADYVQMVVSEVRYVERFNTVLNDDNVEVSAPVFVEFETSTANEVYLDMSTSFFNYKARHSESQKGWTFEKGDRIRFIYDAEGKLYDFLEFEIKEQRDKYFVIPVLDSLGKISPGTLVEVFRIKQKVEKSFFYEIGEYNKVLNPYTPNRAWESTSILLNTGDAYHRTRKMYATDNDGAQKNYSYGIEDQSPSDATILRDNDIGRPDFVNDNYKQLRRKSVIRFGGELVPQSLINNLRTFIATDEAPGGIESYGPITVMFSSDDQLFVAQHNKCHTRHINKTEAFMGDGEQFILNSERFISQAYYLNKDAGCRNPESFQNKSGGGFLYDVIRGKTWEYNIQAGLQIFSGYDEHYNRSGMQQTFFDAVTRILKLIPDDIYPLVCKVVGGYDPENFEYNISFHEISITLGQSLSYLNGKGVGSNIGDNDPQFKTYGNAINTVQLAAVTKVFSDKHGMWFGSRSYLPEVFGYMGNDMFALIQGKLYECEKGDRCCVFFGVKYPQRITIVMNEAPSELKDYSEIELETDTKWSNIRNLVPFNPIHGRQQVSRVPDSMIEAFNRVYHYTVLKDENTPNVAIPLHEGDDMAGEIMIMTFENSSDSKVKLFCANVYAIEVARTNV